MINAAVTESLFIILNTCYYTGQLENSNATPNIYYTYHINWESCTVHLEIHGATLPYYCDVFCDDSIHLKTGPIAFEVQAQTHIEQHFYNNN